MLTDLSVDVVAGKGSGLTEEQFENKKRVIQKAIEVNKPDKSDI